MEAVMYRPEKLTGFSNPQRRQFSGRGYRVMLTAGANYLTEGAIAALKAHPGIDRFTLPGVIEFKESTDTVEKSGDRPANLLHYNLEHSQDLIAVETSKSLLEEWAEADNRKGVETAVARRLNQIAEGNI